MEIWLGAIHKLRNALGGGGGGGGLGGWGGGWGGGGWGGEWSDKRPPMLENGDDLFIKMRQEHFLCLALDAK